MPCSRKKALITKLFFIIIRILKFFFFFLYFLSLFFVKFITYFFRSEDDFIYDEEEYDELSLEEDDEEDEEEEIEEQLIRHSYVNKRNDIFGDIVNGGEGLIFKRKESDETEENSDSCDDESIFEDPIGNFDELDQSFYVEDCNTNSSDSDNDSNKCDDFADYEVIKKAYSTIPQHKRFEPANKDIDYITDNDQIVNGWSQSNNNGGVIPQNDHEIIEVNLKDNNKGENGEREIEIVKETNFTRDEKFLIFDPPKSDSKKLFKEKYEIFEDTNDIGSTSKSSSDWRSSIPDSGTEDPFSSSSRRSCPKWESYTVYQKYDEEMIFLDKISAQKLHETESLRSFQVEPRSISQRIVHKMGNNKQKSLEQNYKKSYYELEATYVAQICLAWEALNWNYTNFRRKRVSTKEEDKDHGCPAYIAQQFQQLQVLLQRYIENEPYERGRRPEIYARMRFATPKLLHVPEYHDYEEVEDKEESLNARITSKMFVEILEETIQTFMNFLKADKKSHCQILTSLFKRRRKGTVDPAIIHVAKKLCNKKKLKLKEVQHNCILFKKKKISREEEMEILMGLIDLQVVSRVLRMIDITQEQLQWCEDKMNKVRLLQGKLQRDSSPLFFPPHSHINNNIIL